MKSLLLTFFATLIILSSQSQLPTSDRGEFATNSNGLMYSDADMKVLRFIVDSLNVRFKTCELNKMYYSCAQAKVYNVEFESKNDDLKEIIKDIENNADFHQLIDKYAALRSTIDTSEIFIRAHYKNINGNNYYLQGKPILGYNNVYLDKKYDGKELSAPWVYNYSPKDKYDKKYLLSCRYFPEKLKQQLIPEKYARLLQYVDCMIDTSSEIFLTDKYSRNFYIGEDNKEGYANLGEINKYLDKKMNLQNDNSYRLIPEEKINFAITHLTDDEEFKNILVRTIDDYARNKTPNHQLEHLAEKVGLYNKALLMKRCYRVMGTCSMDESPRLHARDIAILAAQAHSWDIFLRAHLDIMNDRFERASDGSYAWGGRKTYLKELEELNLNIVDLMLGLTLRSDNAAEGHYFGTIWRLGWSLTESKEKDRFEANAFAIMKDDSLDEFNRGLIFLLYKTYINHLDDKEKEEKIKSLQQNADSFPVFIQASIKELNIPKIRARK